MVSLKSRFYLLEIVGLAFWFLVECTILSQSVQWASFLIPVKRNLLVVFRIFSQQSQFHDILVMVSTVPVDLANQFHMAGRECAPFSLVIIEVQYASVFSWLDDQRNLSIVPTENVVCTALFLHEFDLLAHVCVTVLQALFNAVNRFYFQFNVKRECDVGRVTKFRWTCLASQSCQMWSCQSCEDSSQFRNGSQFCGRGKVIRVCPLWFGANRKKHQTFPFARLFPLFCLHRTWWVPKHHFFLPLKWDIPMLFELWYRPK